jgi:hypothetical protein
LIYSTDAVVRKPADNLVIDQSDQVAVVGGGMMMSFVATQNSTGMAVIVMRWRAKCCAGIPREDLINELDVSLLMQADYLLLAPFPKHFAMGEYQLDPKMQHLHLHPLILQRILPLYILIKYNEFD